MTSSHPDLIEQARLKAMGPDSPLNWYILIDASEFTEIPPEMAEAIYLFTGIEEYEHLGGHGPWLFSATDWTHAKTLLGHWLERNRFGVSWLASALSASEIASHLVRQLQARLPDQEVMTLRFFDPRVFGPLVTVLEPAQRDRLMGGIGAWFVATGQTPIWIKGADRPSAEATAYEISQSQLDRLAQLLLPYTVLGELKTTQPEMLSLYSLAEQHEGVIALIGAAKRYGLTALNDIAAFCSLGFDFDPGFHEHPDIALSLQTLTSGASLSDAIAPVHQSVWTGLSEKNAWRKSGLAL